MEENIKIDQRTEEAEKIKQEMLKAIEKMAKERQAKALKRKVTTNLEEIAASNTRDELKDILSTLKIKFKAADKKDLLISNLKENYKEAMTALFNNINGDLYNDLKIVEKNNGILNMKEEENFKSNSYLEILGILYLASDEEKNLYLVAPEEALEAIKNIDKAIVERNDKIIKLFKGMVSYYGSVSLDEFIENLPKEFNLEISEEHINEILVLAEDVAEDRFYIDAIGESDFLENSDDLDDLMKAEGLFSGAYKKLSVNDLIAASEKRYIGEKAIYKQLIKVFKDNYDIPTKVINGLLEEIYIYSQFNSEESLIDFMVAEIKPPEFVEVKLKEALHKVYNRIPMWKYRGFTNAQMNKEDEEIATTKIGRNDKCPCGSGKKYKKCCGK